MAKAQGLSFVGLYVYPPVLADLLLPLTFLSLPAATHLWLGINVGFLILTAFLLTRLLKLPMLSLGAGLLLLSVLCFTPALQCLVDGQITIFLLLLWAAGLLLYQEDHVEASAVLFALAAAIKLTPALVVLPFLIWRHWRFVRAFALSLLAFILASGWINTPHTLVVYARRVLPAMSGAIPSYANYSLPSATQRLLTVLRTGTVAPLAADLPASTVLAGRLASISLLLLLLTLLLRARHSIDKRGQVLVLALLGLMAPILSPVSWFHAYATAFVAFVLLWRDCLHPRTGTLFLVLLTAVTLLLGSPVSENLVPFLLFTRHNTALACLLQIGQLLAASGVIFYRLWKLGPATAGMPQGAPRLSA